MRKNQPGKQTAQPRNYKAEYARRIARGQAKGLSRSQARGHARATEKPARLRLYKPRWDLRLERGVKALRHGKPLTNAAKDAGVSPERLRAYVERYNLAKKKGGKWIVSRDRRIRRMSMQSIEGDVAVEVSLKAASLIGVHHNAVKRFLESNDTTVLEPFVGRSIRDVDGKSHTFETTPNTLYRRVHPGGDSFLPIYRIVSHQ